MSRIAPINAASASQEQQDLLANVKKAMGMVPNLVSTLAHSPAAANAYLGFNGALAKGVLGAKMREKIALTVGQANSCDYCLAAHSTLGKMAGLTPEEITAARQATCGCNKTAAALSFAAKIVSERGLVSDEDVAAVRAAGWNDAEIAEIVANTALNIFTNYFNHVADTAIDFPLAPKLEQTCGTSCKH